MIKRFEHGGNIYQPVPDGGSWLDFSANINPLGLPESVRQALAAHLDAVVHYPDPAGTDLRQSLEGAYGIPAGAMVLGNGAAELFYLYMHTFRPQRVLLPVPSFSEYERAARAAGAVVSYEYLKEDDGFAFPWETLRRSCGQTDCIILGNPNNPTGTLATADEVLALAEVGARKGTDILVDESFLDFLESDEAYSVLSQAGDRDNLFVIRSLTKFYALPGLRLGFGVASPLRCGLMEGHKDGWNVNVLAQYAGVAGLGDQAYQQASRQLVKQEKDWLYHQMKKIPGLCVYPPCVNFVFWKLTGAGARTADLAEALRARGLLIRDCANYPGLTAAYGRTAVRTHEENERLVALLRENIR
ncbi:MAG: threonine-phosphate decarboxylase CobD [Megasphaera sp.]|uniref:threonine-phosphate decarboxylase CobD n=1 Tax=Megasphaera sp. TaxID=2023260 RepID=UPI0025BD0D94|nr:threonine-phosphate decarboxylase CobD [Megasphaera sp.]MCI7600812.1 threonine-phosphate decarboxylase CobD [Megasphaera sp.]